MVQMDIPAAFAFAQLFAWCGRKKLAQEEPSSFSRYTAISVAYALGVIAPCALYLYGGWPEWETMYWFRSVRMETSNFGDARLALFGPLFIAMLALASGGSFLLAHQWIRTGRERRVLVGIVIGLALSIGVVLVTPSAPAFVGHLSDYRAYINEAVTSSNPQEYGIFVLGPWVVGTPWSADPELLVRHHIVTILHRGFLIPLLIDSFIYFGCTAALALWFHRQNPAQVIPMPQRSLSLGRSAGRQ